MKIEIRWDMIGMLLIGVGLCGLGYEIAGWSGWGLGLSIAVGYILLKWGKIENET